MLPPVQPVGIVEFRDSSTMPDLSLFWTGTDIADSADAVSFVPAIHKSLPALPQRIGRNRHKADPGAELIGSGDL